MCIVWIQGDHRFRSHEILPNALVWLNHMLLFRIFSWNVIARRVGRVSPVIDAAAARKIDFKFFLMWIVRCSRVVVGITSTSVVVYTGSITCDDGTLLYTYDAKVYVKYITRSIIPAVYAWSKLIHKSIHLFLVSQYPQAWLHVIFDHSYVHMPC